MEQRSADLIWRLGALHDDERRLIVVDIDEPSLQEIGPWPWPHETQARLIDQIAAQGARQQIFDLVFTEPRAHSQVLVQAIQQHQPVLSQVFALEQGGKPSVGQLAGALDWATCPQPFGQADGFLANFPALQPGHTGHITPRIATDGIVRHQPAVICYHDKSYPALGLAAFMSGTAQGSITLERGTSALGPSWALHGANFALGPIPLEDNGDLIVSWRTHPDSFISVSAADVIAGRVPRDLMKGAWVLVGGTAFGLNDTIATPYGGNSAGLQVHAQIITALIDGRTPYTPRAAGLLQWLVCIPAAISFFFLSFYRRTFPVYLLPVFALGWATVYWGSHALLLLHQALWVGWAGPALFVVLTGSFMGLLEHSKSRIDRDRLYTHLSSYLPAPVAAALALQPPTSAIRASTKQVSVMFADIRNFSAYCEARPADESAAVLHAFFSTAARVVEAHGGVIESFQGDAVIAVWNGDPSPDPISTQSRSRLGVAYHAQHALNAAIALSADMQGVLPDPAPAGLEPLSIGIGVETGPAMVGSFGMASRRTHMVMGRTVTIASRLVEMTSELSHTILIGEGLAGQVGGVGLQSMGVFMLEGMRAPHHVYAYPLAAEHSYS